MSFSYNSAKKHIFWELFHYFCVQPASQYLQYWITPSREQNWFNLLQHEKKKNLKSQFLLFQIHMSHKIKQTLLILYLRSFSLHVWRPTTFVLPLLNELVSQQSRNVMNVCAFRRWWNSKRKSRGWEAICYFWLSHIQNLFQLSVGLMPHLYFHRILCRVTHSCWYAAVSFVAPTAKLKR